MNPPRVVLVDDDASIRRFVELALEDLPIELVSCASVREAVVALEERPAALLMTDLMMPGESGLDLLQILADSPALAGGARVAVFSAGLNAAMQLKLAGFDIWRRLSKPMSVNELEACVLEACRDAAPSEPAAPVDARAPAPTAGDLDPKLSADEETAVDSHFAGERVLFLQFRAGCRVQFRADIIAGDSAIASGDAQALRRLAHSLKSVLATLGHPALAARSAQLENLADAGEWEPSRLLWHDLRAGLHALALAREWQD